MDKTEIRRKILEYIYQKNLNKPKYMASREELKTNLGINDAELDNNVLYLDGKNLLKLNKRLGAIFLEAEITINGIDSIEKPKPNEKTTAPVTQIIQGNIGVVLGNDNVQTINIVDNFKPIYNEIEKRNPQNKERIISEVETIEEELKKKKPNNSILKKSISYLKENASWIIPSLLILIKGATGA